MISRRGRTLNGNMLLMYRDDEWIEHCVCIYTYLLAFYLIVGSPIKVYNVKQFFRTDGVEKRFKKPNDHSLVPPTESAKNLPSLVISGTSNIPQHVLLAIHLWWKQHIIMNPISIPVREARQVILEASAIVVYPYVSR